MELKVFILLRLPPAPEKPQGYHSFLFLLPFPVNVIKREAGLCLPAQDNPIQVPSQGSQAGGNAVSSRGLDGAAGSSHMPAPRGRAQPKNKQIGFDLGRINEESALYFQEGYLWASFMVEASAPPGLSEATAAQASWIHDFVLKFHVHQPLWSFPVPSASLPCFSYPEISISLPGLVTLRLSPICHKSS